MKVIAGTYKGRPIPFNIRKYRNADITTQKVKEALFSILGPMLAGKNFLDLYACSGQIGLEALSRGALQVVMNERDTQRFRFLQQLKTLFNLRDNAQIYNLPALQCMKICERKELFFDYIFLDPPYIKVKDQVSLYREILESIALYSLLKQEGMLVIQHYAANILPDQVSSYVQCRVKHYGTNSLTFYKQVE